MKIKILIIASVCFALSGCTSNASEGISATPTSGNEPITAEQNTQYGESSDATVSETDISLAEPNEDLETNVKEIEIVVNGQRFTATLEDNETSQVFLKLLPLDVDMQELNGNEKYYRLSEPLPADPSSFDVIESGDLMLFQDNCIVVFYETHRTSYTYTRIGKIDDVAGLAEAIGKGSARIEFKVR